MRWQFKQRRSKYGNWIEWFAWYPVRLNDGATWIWLEYVERKLELIVGPGTTIVEMECRIPATEE